MPIVTVEIVTHTPPPGNLAAELAETLAGVFGGPSSRTWVRVRELANYAEGGGGPQPGVSPVFVSLLMADPPTGDLRADQTTSVTNAVAAACSRPAENVHVIYEPPGAGRVAFGGNLVPPTGH
jgi:phenylpyruvate tautomerase PptA (4-oxalocrotonate tautomerase family)